jgi:2-polyprenyl-3-methyl-5-hydroxy-6-metoxy-1,4-benzoquinol methylase
MSFSKEKILNCVCCNSSELHNLVSIKSSSNLESSMSVCMNCGFYFRDYRFTLEEVQKRYHTDDPENENFLETDKSKECEERRKVRYERNLQWIEANSNSRKLTKSVLDIACGPGSGLLPFRDSGYEVFGIDISPSRVNFAKRILEADILCGTFESFAFEKRFDVIICSHFLEHTHQPLSVLKKIFNLLSDNGLCYLEVPNHFEYATFDDPIYFAHNNNFTKLSLSNTIQYSGFEILSEHNPKTNFHQGSPTHLALVLGRKKESKSHITSPRDNYTGDLIRPYLKKPSYMAEIVSQYDHEKIHSLEYNFSSTREVELHINKKIKPSSVYLEKGGKLVFKIQN